MPRQGWFGILLLSSAGTGVALGHVIASGQEVASLAISLPILVIAGATLWFTIPKRAQLRVDRVSEANLTDLIFYIYPQVSDDGPKEVPGDYLLQLHVAVCNLGDRKAVLSGITIDGFHTASGDTINLPEAPSSLAGSQWVQQFGWVDGQRRHSNVSVPPPYILEGDDVIVVRFRTRRGIDWTDRWTLATLRQFTHPFRSAIVTAFGTVTWRRGGAVIREPFEVPLVVEQQKEYVDLIHKLTGGFSELPTVQPQHITIE